MRRLVQGTQGKPALFGSIFSGGKEGRGARCKVQGARCAGLLPFLPRGAASAVIGPWTTGQLDMQISTCRCGFVFDWDADLALGNFSWLRLEEGREP